MTSSAAYRSRMRYATAWISSAYRVYSASSARPGLGRGSGDASPTPVLRAERGSGPAPSPNRCSERPVSGESAGECRFRPWPAPAAIDRAAAEPPAFDRPVMANPPPARLREPQSGRHPRRDRAVPAEGSRRTGGHVGDDAPRPWRRSPHRSAARCTGSGCPWPRTRSASPGDDARDGQGPCGGPRRRAGRHRHRLPDGRRGAAAIRRDSALRAAQQVGDDLRDPSASPGSSRPGTSRSRSRAGRRCRRSSAATPSSSSPPATRRTRGRSWWRSWQRRACRGTVNLVIGPGAAVATR